MAWEAWTHAEGPVAFLFTERLEDRRDLAGMSGGEVMGQRKGCQETETPRFSVPTQPSPAPPSQPNCTAESPVVGLLPESPPRAILVTRTLGNNGGIVGQSARCPVHRPACPFPSQTTHGPSQAGFHSS